MTDFLYTSGALLAVVALIAWAAERLRLSLPILLVVAGIAIAFVPVVPRIDLDSDLVLLVLLPPIIYYAAFTMSWQGFRRNLSPILLLAVGCVVATTIVVAIVAQHLLALPLAVAFMLGAIVSPPDVLAPLAVAQRLGIPRRLSAILEGEGLVNDATALILFNLALVAALTGQFSLVHAARDFVLVLVGETGWGLVVGFVGLHARHFIREPRIEVMISLLTPYVAFWLPHAVGGSGVLAAVVAGLYTGSAGVTLIRANTRLQALFFWEVVNTVITGLIFLLTGLQARTVATGLDAQTLSKLVLAGLLISAVVIVVRFAWVFPATYIPHLLRRRAREDDLVPSWRYPFIIAFTGVRGVVSLVAALSIPVAIAKDTGFPGRDQVLVVTFVVIVVTLVAQGLTLPWVVRKLGLDQLGLDERRDRKRRETAARVETARAALARLEQAAAEDGLPPETVEPWRTRQQQRIAQLSEATDASGDSEPVVTTVHRVELAMVDAERAQLNRLLREGAISDAIRRRIERDLDLDEERLRRNVHGMTVEDDVPGAGPAAR